MSMDINKKYWKKYQLIIFLQQLGKFSSTPVGIDRLCRISSYSLKGVKQMMHGDFPIMNAKYDQNTKQEAIQKIDKYVFNILTLRRTMRTQRFRYALSMFQKYFELLKKEDYYNGLTDLEKISLIYKVILFAFFMLTDIHDFSGLLAQFRIIGGEQYEMKVLKKTGKIYFIECVAWIVYYVQEYLLAKQQFEKQNQIQSPSENDVKTLKSIQQKMYCLKFSILKQVIDSSISFNYWRPNTMGQGTTVILGLITSLISCTQLWPRQQA